MSGPGLPETTRDRGILAPHKRERPVTAQLAPGAATETALLTVADGFWYQGSITVAERGNAAATFNVRLRVAGEVDATKQFLAKDADITANQVLSPFPELFLGPGDIIEVEASTADVSFTFNGRKYPLDVSYP
jgi:hypothetical protein